MKRLMLAALIAFVLVIRQLSYRSPGDQPASGCDNYASGISKGRHLAARCRGGVKGLLRFLRKAWQEKSRLRP